MGIEHKGDIMVDKEILSLYIDRCIYNCIRPFVKDGQYSWRVEFMPNKINSKKVILKK